MTDRVYPSAKPAMINGSATNPSFPTTKAQLYGATHPTYRPQPHHQRRCCYTFFFWLILTVLIVTVLILLLQIDITDKILFAYNPTSITILSGYINVDDGTIPGFQHPKKNTMLSKPPSSALATCSKVTKPHA
ncbi:hypothetical protein GmHk_07G019835 [Glycine max]|nr:hypothetical protein JHK87_018802 [Glycine soja]KAH1242525.1 hypothetical protein GmHk_07G019835 [Glycine max]